MDTLYAACQKIIDWYSGSMDFWRQLGARGKRGVGRGGAMEECQDTEIPAAIFYDT